MDGKRARFESEERACPPSLITYYPVEKKNYLTQTVLSNPARITTKESAPAFTVTSDRVVGEVSG